MTQKRRNGRRNGRWRGYGVIMLMFALVLSACAGNNEAGVEVIASPAVAPTIAVPTLESTVEPTEMPMATTEASAQATVAGASDATLDEITENPQTYVGQTVTVDGGIDEVKTQRAFTIASSTLVDANEILVLDARQQQIDQALVARQPVRVTGTVRNFITAEVEREIGFDLDAQIEAEYNNKPVIIASNVEVLGDAAAAEATTTGTAEPLETPIGNLGPSSVAVIVSEIGNYIGQKVTVRGEVEKQIGPRTFSMDEDAVAQGGIDNDLLVIAASDILTDTLMADSGVDVTGMIRMFNLAEIERDVNIDLDDALYTEWNDRPVLMAETVQPAPAAAEALSPAVDSTLTETYGKNITVAEIASNAADFMGKQVTVRQDVEEVIGANAFTLDEDATLQAGIDNDLLVVSAQQNLPLINDQLGDTPIAVTGIVRQFDLAAIENEIGFDLDDAMFTDWAGRPVIVASGIRKLQPAVSAPNSGPDGAPANATVAEIVSKAQDWTGKMVAVTEEVEEVINVDALTLDEDALFAGGIDNDLLVIRGAQAMPPFTDALDGRVVQIVGPVRQFDLAAVEQEIGFDLDDAAFADYAGRPAVIVNTLLFATPYAITPVPADATGDANAITVADIASNPSAYVGQQVTVRGEVEELIDAKAFSLDEDALLTGGIDNDLLVINTAQGDAVVTEEVEGEEVMVTGRVRPFITAEIEREYGLSLVPELVVRYESRPMIVAESVTRVE